MPAAARAEADHGHGRAKATARKRRYRARLRDGGAVLAVPTRNVCALIDALMVLGWLRESEAEDRGQIGAAIGALLDDLATSCPAWSDKATATWHARRHD